MCTVLVLESTDHVQGGVRRGGADAHALVATVQGVTVHHPIPIVGHVHRAGVERVGHAEQLLGAHGHDEEATGRIDADLQKVRARAPVDGAEGAL